jgi:hypothetical protein
MISSPAPGTAPFEGQYILQLHFYFLIYTVSEGIVMVKKADFKIFMDVHILRPPKSEKWPLDCFLCVYVLLD